MLCKLKLSERRRARQTLLSADKYLAMCDRGGGKKRVNGREIRRAITHYEGGKWNGCY